MTSINKYANSPVGHWCGVQHYGISKPDRRPFQQPARAPLPATCHTVRKLLFFLYVYWTVHHLDSWIKRDQLDVICFISSLFNAQHVSDVNTSILRSLRLIYWVISWVVLLWFDVCWCYVVVWLWWCGIRMQAKALQCFQCFSLHTDTTPPQPNHNVTPTHIEPENSG